jgi:hypothetical protein
MAALVAKTARRFFRFGSGAQELRSAEQASGASVGLWKDVTEKSRVT